MPVEVSERFERQLVQATRDGVNSVEEISRIRKSAVMSEYEVSNYVQNFTYFFGPDERAGQEEFRLRLNKLPNWRPPASAQTDTSVEKAVSTSN